MTGELASSSASVTGKPDRSNLSKSEGGRVSDIAWSMTVLSLGRSLLEDAENFDMRLLITLFLTHDTSQTIS